MVAEISVRSPFRRFSVHVGNFSFGERFSYVFQDVAQLDLSVFWLLNSRNVRSEQTLPCLGGKSCRIDRIRFNSQCLGDYSPCFLGHACYVFENKPLWFDFFQDAYILPEQPAFLSVQTFAIFLGD